MRNLTTILLLFSFVIFETQAQSELECEQKSKAYANAIAVQFAKPKHNFSAVLALTDAWYSACGYSEPIIRAAILNELLAGNNHDSLIMGYFSSDLHYNYIDRLNSPPNAQDSNYFKENAAYFTYVPVKSKFDSICNKVANQLLDSTYLTSNSRLACRFFSDSPVSFRYTLNNSIYKKTSVYKIIRTNENNHADLESKLNLYFGTWKPFGANNTTFNLNPYIGIGMGKISSGIHTDFAFKLKLLMNDKAFEYKLDQTIHSVNSSYALSGEVNFGIPMYSGINTEFNVVIGAGLESMHTGLLTPAENEDETDTYHNMETVFFQLGLSTEKRQAEQQKIGLAAFLVLAPYNFSSHLITKFSGTSLCVELFIKL